MPVMIDHSYVHNLKQLRNYKKFKFERGKKSGKTIHAW